MAPILRALPVAMARRLAVDAGWAALLMGCWMTFVVTTSPPDVLLGAGSAILAVILVELIRMACAYSPTFRSGWLPGLLKLAPRLFSDTWVVFAALFWQLFLRQPVNGGFRAVIYRGVHETEDEASAADAFVVAANSLTPNSIVLDIDRVEGLLVIHQLAPQSGEELSRQLIRAR